MRTTLKIVLPLIISVVVVSLLFAVYQVRPQKRMLRNDLSRRAEILAESLQENVEPLFDRALPDKSLQRIVDRFGQREHLKGIAVYNANGAVLALTPGLPTSFQTRPATATRAALRDAGTGEFLPVGDQPMQLYAMPLHRNGQAVGTLVLAHDASYIDNQVSNTLRGQQRTAKCVGNLIVDVARIVSENERADGLAVAVKRHRVKLHRLIADGQELASAGIS